MCGVGGCRLAQAGGAWALARLIETSRVRGCLPLHQSKLIIDAALFEKKANPVRSTAIVHAQSYIACTRPGRAGSPRRVSLGLSTFEERRKPVRMMAGAGAGEGFRRPCWVRRERQDENGKIALQAWIQRWRSHAARLDPETFEKTHRHGPGKRPLVSPCAVPALVDPRGNEHWDGGDWGGTK